MTKRKRYSFSVVEETIRSPDYKNFRGGRIEVYDNKDKSGYACYEARFLVPIEFMDPFLEMWDSKESDEMPFIHLAGRWVRYRTTMQKIAEAISKFI